MSREEFLMLLAAELTDLPPEERQDALDYYRECFEEAGPEGEQALLQSLGTPAHVAAVLRANLPQQPPQESAPPRAPQPPPSRGDGPDRGTAQEQSDCGWQNSRAWQLLRQMYTGPDAHIFILVTILLLLPMLLNLFGVLGGLFGAFGGLAGSSRDLVLQGLGQSVSAFALLPDLPDFCVQLGGGIMTLGGGVALAAVGIWLAVNLIDLIAWLAGRARQWAQNRRAEK